jgi:hypothetical protein
MELPRTHAAIIREKFGHEPPYNLRKVAAMNNLSTITIQLPASLFEELKSLGNERHTTPEKLIVELVFAERARRNWLRDLAELRALIAQQGTLAKGTADDELTSRMRAIRRDIFEADYAHLYR